MSPRFFNLREMIGYLKERNAFVVPDETNGKRDINRGLEGMALIGSLYLVLLPVSLQVIRWLLQTDVTPVNGISLIVAVCITLDLTGEPFFRWRLDCLVRIAEFHEPWKAGLAPFWKRKRSPVWYGDIITGLFCISSALI